jgi:UDP-GlcNAc:undecaprenyl-phosphate/decaprenyl-phosphate GlcNAc-1-phosphate transferase
MHSYIIPFSVAFFSSFLFTPLMIKISRLLNVFDHPDKRKMHRVPTPLLGGVAIFIAFNLGVLSSMDYNVPLKGIVYGGTIIFLMGLLDAFYPVSARYRLLGQILSCVILIVSGVYLRIFPFLWLNFLFTLLWVVGITNALNFLDNMDWLASSLVMTTSAFFFILAYLSGNRWLGFLTVSLFASSLGFSFYNIPPAKIFMGDSGSTFMGFILAGIAVEGVWAQESSITGITIPVLILYILIFDMVLITVLRFAEGKVKNFREWLEYTGKDHFSHRLVALGYSPVKAVGIILYLNIILGCIAVILYRLGNPLISLLTLLIVILVSAFYIKRFYGKYLK